MDSPILVWTEIQTKKKKKMEKQKMYGFEYLFLKQASFCLLED